MSSLTACSGKLQTRLRKIVLLEVEELTKRTGRSLGASTEQSEGWGGAMGPGVKAYNVEFLVRFHYQTLSYAQGRIAFAENL